MLTFGQTKNSIEKLKTYLRKMDLQSKTNRIALKQIEQQNLRLSNNEIFLPLLNFLLIQYSSQFYIKVLDRVPDLKLKDDRKFVQNCINISRQMLNMAVSLTADQFLSNKYFQKKLQFIANLAKSVYEWSTQNAKRNKGKQKEKQFNGPLGNVVNFSTMGNKMQFKYQDNQIDEQEEMPMQIRAVPMKIDIKQLQSQLSKASMKNRLQQEEQSKKSTNNYMQSRNGHFHHQAIKNVKNNKKFVVDGEQFDQNQIKIALHERHPTPQPVKKPVVQSYEIGQKMPKKQQKNTISSHSHSHPHQRSHLHGIHNNENDADQNGEDNQYDRFRLEQSKTRKPKTSNSQSVNRNQFNQLVSLVRVMSETVNKISSKFGDLQNNVNTQVQNINARIIMLQSKVRLIQDNL